MGDRSVTKVSAGEAPQGKQGQRYLAAGIRMGMRLWADEPAGAPKPHTARDYETIGYVLRGRARLHLEGQVVDLAPGDSYVVPKGSSHTYEILEAFTAVEATCPPSAMHGRDERTSMH